MFRSVTALAGLAAALLLTGAAPADGSDPQALKLIAELKAASGGAALDRPAAFHETGTVVRDGHAGTYEMWGDLHAMRTSGSHVFGGQRGAGGFDGDAAWRVGPDGKVQRVTDPAVLKGERIGAWLTVAGYFYPDRFPATFKYLGRRSADGHAYEVVAATPKDAATAELWLDADTHRLQRIALADAGVEAHGEVLDYRQVAGTWVAFGLHQVEGDHDMVQTLKTYDYVPLDPRRFAPETAATP